MSHLFNQAYNYEIAHFDGEVDYIKGRGKNQDRLKKVLKAEDFSMLGRRPTKILVGKLFPGLKPV